MRIPEAAQVHGKLAGAFIVFTAAGSGLLCVGVGLYLAKRWARRVWLVLVILLTLFHAARFVAVYQNGIIFLLERVGEVALITSLAVLSWKWLRGEAAMGTLHGETTAT
jgi:cytochrome c biogenesis protein CcdA